MFGPQAPWGPGDVILVENSENMSHQIVDYLIENELSLCAITETWTPTHHQPQRLYGN